MLMLKVPAEKTGQVDRACWGRGGGWDGEP